MQDCYFSCGLRTCSFLVCQQSCMWFSYTCRMMWNGSFCRWTNFGKKILSGRIRHHPKWLLGCKCNAYCIMSMSTQWSYPECLIKDSFVGGFTTSLKALHCKPLPLLHIFRSHELKEVELSIIQKCRAVSCCIMSSTFDALTCFLWIRLICFICAVIICQECVTYMSWLAFSDSLPDAQLVSRLLCKSGLPL